MWFTSGIICGSGSFAVQFGDHFRSGDHLRSGIICGAVQILTLQKRALRLIFFSNKRSYAISLFIASNVLMLYSETVSTMMHDVFSNSTPKNIRQLFVHSSDVHAHNTSFSSARNFIFAEESRLGVKLKSFSAFGARLWTCLSPDRCKLTKRVLWKRFATDS